MTMQKPGFNTIFALAVVAVVGFTACNREPALKTDQERGSYTIGLQLGKNFRRENVDIVVPAFLAGMNDGLAGKEGKLKPEEIQMAMQKMQELVAKKNTEAAEKNNKEGEDFLAKNKTAAGWKTTESGLQYNVVKEGDGATPKDTDVVKVHYTGTLINGEKFDSSRDRGTPAEFPVNRVIPGWTEALKLMKVGAQYKLAIPAKLAYGRDARPGIPANSTLLFDVELIDAKAAPPEPGGMPHGHPEEGGAKKAAPKGKKK